MTARTDGRTGRSVESTVATGKTADRTGALGVRSVEKAAPCVRLTPSSEKSPVPTVAATVPALRGGRRRIAAAAGAHDRAGLVDGGADAIPFQVAVGFHGMRPSVAVGGKEGVFHVAGELFAAANAGL